MGTDDDLARPVADGRRRQVLESALDTFARQGYRATSMEDVARRARISRPGLYLYFSSKQDLLRAACEHALARDVELAESLLGDGAVPLEERLFAALDLWTGQYVGPLAADLDPLLDQDGDLLGDIPRTYSERFSDAVASALRSGGDVDPGEDGYPPGEAELTRDVILALALGLKHRVASREEFRSGLAHGLGLILRSFPARPPRTT